jgi:ABC-type transport system involved in cytochrome c biogenesis permease subunit
MKRFLPLLVLLLAVGYVLSTLYVPATAPGAFDLTAFGRLPVLVNGRIKPLDTVARTSLLEMQNRQRVSDPTDPQPLVASPIEWLADVLFNPAKADTYPTFRISATDSPELLTLMGLTEADTKIHYDNPVLRVLVLADFVPGTRTRFSFKKLEPKLDELDRQANLADPVDPQARTQFQKAVVQLRERVLLYQRLKHSVQAPDSPDFLEELTKFQKALPAGVEAVRAKQKKEPANEDAYKAMITMAERYDFMDKMGNLLAVPPPDDEPNLTAWKSVGRALLETFQTGTLNPNIMAYAALGHAWRDHQPAQFNEITRLYREQLSKRFSPQLKKSDIETRFNAAEPFYNSMTFYAYAFFIAIFSWLKWPEVLGKSAFYLVFVAFIVATAGIITRMWLEGRPPVTNLYSSALFVGWGSVGLCLILEKFYRNAIGSVAAGIIGFITLLIAHHLALSGDTLEMMRAVLDTNLWLATHVVVVTTGYAATFLAGFLALIYVVRGTLTKSLDKPTADALARMVYGIVCFATLCSLVGTVLGGIWADQSWGRFWGWDPKENGAVMIVLWNAIILHARWGGFVKQRGLMSLAIFGNIITSWSWFGTNMLGVGLHSYGFMDAAFYWLIAFVASQLLLITLASTPLEKWRSFRPVSVRKV